MSSVLQAELGSLSLGSLLQLVESDGLSGAFRVEPEGSLVFRRGRLTGAVHGRLDGVDAALTLLMVKSTRVEFEMFEVDEAHPIADLMALIIDGARLNDDWGNLASRVLKARGGLDFQLLTRDVRAVVSLLDGQRVVDEAIYAADVDPIVVIDALLDMLRNGDLKEVAPPNPDRLRRQPATLTPPPAPLSSRGPEDFFEVVDASRVALRSKDYASAVRLLTIAHKLRPNDRAVAQNLRRIGQLIEQKQL